MEITLKDYKKLIQDNDTLREKVTKEIERLNIKRLYKGKTDKEIIDLETKMEALLYKQMVLDSSRSMITGEAINNDLFRMNTDELIKEIENVYPSANGKITVDSFVIEGGLSKDSQKELKDMHWEEFSSKLKDSQYLYENSQDITARLWIKYDNAPLCLIRVFCKHSTQFEDGRYLAKNLAKANIPFKNSSTTTFYVSQKDASKLMFNFVPEDKFVKMSEKSKKTGINLEGIQTAIFNCAEKKAELNANGDISKENDKK